MYACNFSLSSRLRHFVEVKDEERNSSMHLHVCIYVPSLHDNIFLSQLNLNQDGATTTNEVV